MTALPKGALLTHPVHFYHSEYINREALPLIFVIAKSA